MIATNPRKRLGSCLSVEVWPALRHGLEAGSELATTVSRTADPESRLPSASSINPV